MKKYSAPLGSVDRILRAENFRVLLARAQKYLHYCFLQMQAWAERLRYMDQAGGVSHTSSKMPLAVVLVVMALSSSISPTTTGSASKPIVLPSFIC